MIQRNNPLTSHGSGKIGNLVFRQLRGETVVSKMPDKPDKSMETVAQRRTRDAMRTASRFAKDITQNPEWKEYYKAMAKKLMLPNAYTAALTDYRRKGDPRAVYPLRNEISPLTFISRPLKNVAYPILKIA